MHKKIITWFNGYILASIEGESKERFLNLCKTRNIKLWKINSEQEIYKFYICVKDYIMLRSIVRKTKILPKILKKEGLPFFVNKFKNRQALIVGMMTSIFIIYICSLFIWDIQISGESAHTKEALLVYLDTIDVNTGTRVKDIDCRRIEEQIRKEYNDIAWVSARVSGTRLKINLKENKILTEVKKNNQTKSLIAANDGIVKSIVTRCGTPMVKKNDKVKKGDVVVSGNIMVMNDNNEVINVKKCMADADVYIQHTVKYSDKFSEKYNVKTYTGKNNKTVEVFFDNIKIFLNLPFKKNVNCDIIVTAYKIKIGENLYTPISVLKKEYKYYKDKEKVLSKEEVGEQVNKKFKRFCDEIEQSGAKLIEKKVTYVTKSGDVVVNGFVKVIEKSNKYVPVENVEGSIREDF